MYPEVKLFLLLIIPMFFVAAYSGYIQNVIGINPVNNGANFVAVCIFVGLILTELVVGIYALIMMDKHKNE